MGNRVATQMMKANSTTPRMILSYRQDYNPGISLQIEVKVRIGVKQKHVAVMNSVGVETIVIV